MWMPRPSALAASSLSRRMPRAKARGITRAMRMTNNPLTFHPHRQAEREGRALPRTRLHPDPPAVQLDDPPRDRQPQTRPALRLRARVVELLERLEDRLLV